MVNEQLLELVGTVHVPATDEFVARDKLVIDTSEEADLRIAWLGTTFAIQFCGTMTPAGPESSLRYHRMLKPLTDGGIMIALGGKDDAELIRLCDELTKLFVVHERETRAALDALELGNGDMDAFAATIKDLRATQRELQQQRDARFEKIETKPEQMFALLQKQGRGEEGPLLLDGLSNIFYLRDTKGVLRSVHLMWSSDGWLLYVYQTERPHRWSDGYRVFSIELLGS